jgi:hypothetical protein
MKESLINTSSLVFLKIRWNSTDYKWKDKLIEKDVLRTGVAIRQLPEQGFFPNPVHHMAKQRMSSSAPWHMPVTNYLIPWWGRIHKWTVQQEHQDIHYATAAGIFGQPLSLMESSLLNDQYEFHVVVPDWMKHSNWVLVYELRQLKLVKSLSTLNHKTILHVIFEISFFFWVFNDVYTSTHSLHRIRIFFFI